jgi:antitoxin (DNA-binding transcriptional repressor) of toxin-antitoxin stability system
LKFMTVSELRGKATSIVSEIEASGEEMIITKNGKPVVLMRRVSESEFRLKPAKEKGGGDGKGKGPV